MIVHRHELRDTIVGCEDCGEHPAVICDTSDPCPSDYDWQPIDLIYQPDPREIRYMDDRAYRNTRRVVVVFR